MTKQLRQVNLIEQMMFVRQSTVPGCGSLTALVGSDLPWRWVASFSCLVSVMSKFLPKRPLLRFVLLEKLNIDLVRGLRNPFSSAIVTGFRLSVLTILGVKDRAAKGWIVAVSR